MFPLNKTVSRFIFYTIFLSQFLIGIFCNTSENIKDFESNELYVELIDSLTFKDYNFIFLKDKSEKKYYLLTFKTDNCDLLLYSRLRAGNKFNFNLINNDLITYISTSEDSKNVDSYQDKDEKLLWKRGKLITKTYFSNNICNLLIKK